MFRDAVIGILATIAKQERVRLSERTIAGLERAKAQGRVGGRPRVICDRTRILKLRQVGKSLAQIASELKLAKTTVHRIVEAAGGGNMQLAVQGKSRVPPNSDNARRACRQRSKSGLKSTPPAWGATVSKTS